MLSLRDAGWAVVNLACGLGRPEDHECRRAELAEACQRAGFDLQITEPPIAMSGGDDATAAELRVMHAVAACVQRVSPRLVIAPSPGEAHPAHALVARGTLRAIESAERPLRVALWGLWASLPVTTTVVGLADPVLARVIFALQAHRSQILRTPYDELVRARARASAVLEPERALGFGSALGRGPQLAGALCELRFDPAEGWSQALPRVLHGAQALAISPEWRPVDRPL